MRCDSVPPVAEVKMEDQAKAHLEQTTENVELRAKLKEIVGKSFAHSADRTLAQIVVLTSGVFVRLR